LACASLFLLGHSTSRGASLSLFAPGWVGGALRLVFVEASKGVALCLVGMTQEPGPDRQTRNCADHMYWNNSSGLPALDCNLYSQAFSHNSPTPEHPVPFSITCAARTFYKSRDPAPSTEQDCNRIASVGRLFGNRRRTERRSVRAAACSDDEQAHRQWCASRSA